ncbi:MAG: DNA-3-methyladenine glycosylase I [Cytophagaceae bacterium]|nr:DNA-3-methyladenine glycosylase I [Gemmatimonadaceae bacterium]
MPITIVAGADGLTRCSWCGTDPLYVTYHDREWGRPVSDDRRLFEKLCLEGFQAGLSWLTILRKRENFRAAFDGFDFEKVARYNTRKVDRLLLDAGIVRHRGKIESTINNAKRACDLVAETGSIAALLWSFEPGPRSRPKRLTPEVLSAMATTPESTAMSKALKQRGWSFVGPTTMYAAMQAMGMVNDHLETCHARTPVEQARAAFSRPR